MSELRITAAGRQNALSEDVYHRIFEIAGDLDDDRNARLVYTLYAWLLVGRDLDQLPSERDLDSLAKFMELHWSEVEEYATSAALLYADDGSRVQ